MSVSPPAFSRSAHAGAGCGDVAGVVLAAGAGTRLRPLTDLRPKPLCPVANVPLVDAAVQRLRSRVSAVAVNAHHHLEAMRQHLRTLDVHMSVERHRALGTAGALGLLRGWLDGRGAIVANADVWGSDDLGALTAGWNGQTVRLLVTIDSARPDFDGLWRFAGVSVMPWNEVRRIPPEPAGLFEVSWRRALSQNRVEFVPSSTTMLDCGTPAAYLGANLLASGGRSVIGEGAVVRGRVEHSVVWPGAAVAADERLCYAIRLCDGRTVLPVEASRHERHPGRLGDRNAPRRHGPC